MSPLRDAKSRQHLGTVRIGFTLVELLVVIAIIGILAAIAVPNIRNFTPNVTAAAERQLLDALARARQLAISQRTTVYMVFCPTNFWSPANDPGGTFQSLSGLTPPPGVQPEVEKAMRLLNKQMIGYAFVALRTLGDQPGQNTPRYLSGWQTLPEGAYIPPEKFLPYRRNPSFPVLMITNVGVAYPVLGFQYTNTIPFPSDTVAAYLRPPTSYPNFAGGQGYVPVPYIAFNYQGQLVDAANNPTGVDELIPLSKGAVLFGKNPDKTVATNSPSILESPAGNTTNSYDIIKVDWLTGRAHAEHMEIRGL